METRTVLVARQDFEPQDGDMPSDAEIEEAVETAAEDFYAGRDSMASYTVLVRDASMMGVQLPDDYDREESSEITRMAWTILWECPAR